MTDCWNRPLRYNQPDVVRRFGLLASNTVMPRATHDGH